MDHLSQLFWTWTLISVAALFMGGCQVINACPDTGTDVPSTCERTEAADEAGENGMPVTGMYPRTDDITTDDEGRYTRPRTSGYVALGKAHRGSGLKEYKIHVRSSEKTTKIAKRRKVVLELLPLALFAGVMAYLSIRRFSLPAPGPGSNSFFYALRGHPVSRPRMIPTVYEPLQFVEVDVE